MQYQSKVYPGPKPHLAQSDIRFWIHIKNGHSAIFRQKKTQPNKTLCSVEICFEACLFIPMDSKKSIGSKPSNFYFKSCYKSQEGWVLWDVLSQKFGVNHLRVSSAILFNKKCGPHYYQWLLIDYYKLLNHSEYSNASVPKSVSVPLLLSSSEE